MTAQDMVGKRHVVEEPSSDAAIAQASGSGGFRLRTGAIGLGLALSLGLSLGACALLPPGMASAPAAPSSGTNLASTLASIDTGASPAKAAASSAASAAAPVVDTRPVPSDLRVVTSGADSRVANVAAGTAVDNEAAQNPASPSYQSVSTTPPAPRIRTIDPETMRLALALATGPTNVRSQGVASDATAAATRSGDANGWQLQSVVAVTRPDAGPGLARAETAWLRAQQLLPLRGCPAPNQLYLYADVSTNAGDSARRAADAMASGCGVPVHRQADPSRPDPIFDSLDSRACTIDIGRVRRDVRSGPLARQMQGKKSADALLQYVNADQGALLRASPYLTSRRATLAMRQVLGALTQQRFGVTVPWTHASTDSRVYWIVGDGAMFDAVTALLDGMATRRPNHRAGQPAQWLFSLWRNPADSHYYVKVNAIDPSPATTSRAGRIASTALVPSSTGAVLLSQCDGSDTTGACALEDFQRSVGQRLANDCTRLTP